MGKKKSAAASDEETSGSLVTNAGEEGVVAPKEKKRRSRDRKKERGDSGDDSPPEGKAEFPRSTDEGSPPPTAKDEDSAAMTEADGLSADTSTSKKASRGRDKGRQQDAAEKSGSGEEKPPASTDTKPPPLPMADGMAPKPKKRSRSRDKRKSSSSVGVADDTGQINSKISIRDGTRSHGRASGAGIKHRSSIHSLSVSPTGKRRGGHRRGSDASTEFQDGIEPDSRRHRGARKGSDGSIGSNGTGSTESASPAHHKIRHRPHRTSSEADTVGNKNAHPRNNRPTRRRRGGERNRVRNVIAEKTWRKDFEDVLDERELLNSDSTNDDKKKKGEEYDPLEELLDREAALADKERKLVERLAARRERKRTMSVESDLSQVTSETGDTSLTSESTPGVPEELQVDEEAEVSPGEVVSEESANKPKTGGEGDPKRRAKKAARSEVEESGSSDKKSKEKQRSKKSSGSGKVEDANSGNDDAGTGSSGETIESQTAAKEPVKLSKAEKKAAKIAAKKEKAETKAKERAEAKAKKDAKKLAQREKRVSKNMEKHKEKFENVRDFGTLTPEEIQAFKEFQIEKYEREQREQQAQTARFLDIAEGLGGGSESDTDDEWDVEAEVKRRNSFDGFDLDTRVKLKAYAKQRRPSFAGSLDSGKDEDGEGATDAHPGIIELPTIRSPFTNAQWRLRRKLTQSRAHNSHGTLPGGLISKKSLAAEDHAFAQLTFDLPQIAVLRILSFLELPDILHAELVCSKWRDAARSPELWQGLVSHYDRTLYAEYVKQAEAKDKKLAKDIAIWEDPLVIAVDDLAQKMEENRIGDNNAEEDTEQDGHEKLSLNQLVAQITPFAGISNKTDWGAFFITYQTFTDAFLLSRKFVQRFNVPFPDEIAKLSAGDQKRIDFVRHWVMPIQLRVVLGMRRLVQDHFSDLDDRAKTLLRTFIRATMLTNPHLATSLRNAFKGALKGSSSTRTDADSFIGGDGDPKGKDPKKNKWLPSRVDLVSLLDICKNNLDVVAEQLTLVEFQYFKQIKPADLVSQAYQKAEGESLTQKMIDHFNDVSRWVADTILKEEKPRARANRMAQFVEIAGHLRNLRNFETLMAIISSLYDPAISRLKITRGLLRPRSERLMEELHTLMSGEKSYAAYREELGEFATPCIPYLGVFMRDLIYWEEESQNKAPKGEEVSFWKKKFIFGIVDSIETCQRASYRNLFLEARIADLLRDLPVPEVGNEQYREVLFDLSLMREPRAVRRRT